MITTSEMRTLLETKAVEYGMDEESASEMADSLIEIFDEYALFDGPTSDEIDPDDLSTEDL